MISSSGPEERIVPRGAAGWLTVLTAITVFAVTFSVAVSSIAMGAAFLLFAWTVARNGLRTIPLTGLEAAFGAFIAAEILASAFSVDPADSFYNMRRVLLIGIVYVVLASFKTERQARILLGGLGVTAAAMALLETISLERVNGVLERPMMFQLPLTEGGIRMMILMVLLPFVLSRSTPGKWRWALGATLLPLAAGLVITQARSAWVAFVAGITVIGILMDRRILAGLLLLVIVFLLFAPADFRQRAESIVDIHEESNYSRVQMLTTGWKMFLERPVFGWGDIGLRNYYVTYVRPLTDGEGGHLHNNFTEALVTLGVVGFAAVLYLFFALLRLMIRAATLPPRGSFRRSLGTGLLAAYAGFHVLGLFEWNFGDHEVMVLMWFFTGLAAWIVKGPGEDCGEVRAGA